MSLVSHLKVSLLGLVSSWSHQFIVQGMKMGHPGTREMHPFPHDWTLIQSIHTAISQQWCILHQGRSVICHLMMCSMDGCLWDNRLSYSINFRLDAINQITTMNHCNDCCVGDLTLKNDLTELHTSWISLWLFIVTMNHGLNLLVIDLT